MTAADLLPEQLNLAQRAYLNKKLVKLARKRVKRAIRLLDKRVGKDWPYIIQLDELDLSSGTYCVIGQLGPRIVEKFGGPADPDARYTAGMECLFGEYSCEGDAIRYGFTNDGLLGWRILNYVWEFEIRKLQQIGN